jgi:hypothetical protein
VLGHQGRDDGLLPCGFIHQGSYPAVVCYLIALEVPETHDAKLVR